MDQPTPFILPAWHVVLVHYPLALLTIGLLLELAGFFWPAVRNPARWMILVGTLSCLPTLASGLHAFRAAVSADDDGAWARITRGSEFSAEQFALMRRHILLACAGCAAALIGVITWLAAGDTWRRKLHLPCLLAVGAAVALMTASAWHAGDAVFRLGTGVEKQERPHLTLASALPPIELHMFLAGAVAALVLLIFALSVRGLTEQPAPPARSRWWWILLAAALATALAGVWSADFWPPSTLFGAVAWSSSHRYFVHTVLGAAIILLPLPLAILARRQHKMVLPVGAVILVLLLAAQVWIGVLLMYDSSDGPLTSFNPPSAATSAP